MAERGFRQKHAGKESAHGHRKTADLHQKRRTEHHQQRRSRHHLTRAGSGQQAEKRVEKITPGQDERADGGKRDADGDPALRRRHMFAARTEEGDKRQQRHDGQILKQQDGDDALALEARHAVAFLQHLHDDRRRGQHETGAGDEGHDDGKAEADAHQRQTRHTDQHLQGTQPENILPHRPQPRGLHFKADDEQEHHHAEFRYMQNGLRIGKETETIRPDHKAGGQITEHRAEADALEDRRGDNACRQQYDHLGQIISVRFYSHTPPR
ncbi:hypothetical protein D3C78_1243750 [compost metagenome]